MVAQEKSFPRGGASIGEAPNSSKKLSLFRQKSKKIKSKKKVKHHAVTGAEPKLMTVEDLSYKVLSEGMLVLVQVTDITDYHLHVSMPGLTVGRVPITQVSEPYSLLLQSMSHSDDNIETLCPLSEMFYKGQLLPAQVWQIKKTADKRHTVSLSLDPKNIHSEWSHSAMARKGLVITAAIKSKEEHGYVMECGVNGLRSFLKEEKALNYCETFNGGRPLAIGQLVTCAVVSAEVTSVASKIELSADPEDIAKQEEIGNQSVDMQNILPSMRFQLTVTDTLREGVKVKFHNLTGYIHRNHILNKGSSEEFSFPSPGTTLFGRILYVTPIAKSVYLSALPNVSAIVKEIPKPSPAEVNFKIGDIVDCAKVIGVGKKGVFLQLGKKKLNIQGFVPDRRIGFNYKGKLEDNDDEVTMLQRLRNKFPLGSSIRCRLLHFDSLSQTYVCSMEKSVLNEKYLTLSDIHVSDVVPCIVEDVRNGGIIVRVGMLNGYVPATHSADVPLHQPAKKFTPGTRVSGRVLKVDIDKRRLIVTLKQTLVSSHEPIITSYQSARKGVCYLGTVVAISPNGVFVSFFGGVRGFLESNKFNSPDAQKFFLGQLLKCYVTRRNDKQIRLSLNPPNGFMYDQVACKAVHIGQSYSLEVVSVESTGLGVKIIDDGDCFNACGIIPILHLSDDPQMCHSLLDTFEIGTVLTNVWCYSNMGTKHPITFSMRSSVIQFFKSTQGKIANKKTLEAVCPGWVLPCTVKKICPSYILLQVPLNSVGSLVKVTQEYICGQNETISSLGLIEEQGIQAKVLQVHADKNNLVLGCKRNQLWNKELETCILYLSKYLCDQKRLLAHAKKAGDPLGAYSVGVEVSGVVVEKTEWGFIFELSNGARGEATFFNCQSDTLELGSPVKGKVLNVDCLRKHVEITLRKDTCSILKKKSSSENDLIVDADVQLRGPTLLVTPEFMLVQLKGAGKCNLGYIPTHLYPFGPSTLAISDPFFGIDRKVVIKRCSDGLIICLPKEVLVDKRKEDKRKQKMEERKANRKTRYFNAISGQEDIKKEEDEEDDDDQLEISMNDNDDIEETRKILDTTRDIRIIDDDMDSISDDDSINDLEDSDCDIEPPTKAAPQSRKRKLSSTFETKKSKEDKEVDASFMERKRKSSGSSDIVMESLPAESKKKSNENCESAMKPKKRSKKEKDIEVISLEDTTDEFETKKKKTKKEAARNSDDIIVPSIEGKLKISAENCQNGEKLTLKSPGFLWDIDSTKFMQVLEPSKHETSSDEDSDDDLQSKKKKRKKSAAERKEAAKVEEERLQRLEQELMDPNRQLSSCDDFDRMVLANPDSSTVWLQYMAFHLQATEIEKARAVAQRAIKSISYREEQEKLNVWLGLLNLENLYGTPESLKTTLDQALQTNDPYKIRSHMVRKYAESGKTKELDSEVRLVVKKFKETPGMWQEIGAILMNHGYAEKARVLLQQALPHLKNKKESVGLAVQFALMEARNNNVEQAKALMDPILASYPQRVDVWCTYCDMLIRANQIDEARELMERSVSLKLQARKMKTLFTKFLQFEEAHGSKEGQDRVRVMAMEYLKQAGGNESMEEA